MMHVFRKKMGSLIERIKLNLWVSACECVGCTFYQGAKICRIPTRGNPLRKKRGISSAKLKKTLAQSRRSRDGIPSTDPSVHDGEFSW